MRRNYYEKKGGMKKKKKIIKEREMFKEEYEVIKKGKLRDIVKSLMKLWEKKRIWVIERNI